MPTYVLPQVLVFQDFQIVPSAVANPLRAHISGGHAQLIRYAHADERVNGELGFYDWLLATAYNWPDRPAGGIADLSYVKLWMQDALLQYFEEFIGDPLDHISKLAGYNNRIESATRSFAANGTAFPRYSGLFDRDVKIGDVAKVRGITTDSESVTLWTYVKNIIGEPIPSSVGDASVDANNASTQSEAATIAFVSGPQNCVSPTVDGTQYNGLRAGDVVETYDIIITQGSVGGDYTLATARIISGSGHDDVTSQAIAAKGSPTAIGVRGLTVTFQTISSAGCSDSAEDNQIDPDDLYPGQRWHVVVHQQFTKPLVTSGGVFDSASDTTYIITVLKGGFYNSTTEPPQFLVSTTNGIDMGSPVTVTAANTMYPCGTLGVTIEFTGTALRAGDRYYIPCTGSSIGAMRILELGHNLDVDIAPGSHLDLTLFIRNPLLQISQDRIGEPPLTNYDLSETQITVNDGIQAFDPTWTESGVQKPLDVISEVSKNYGLLFVEVRYWLCNLGNDVFTINDPGNLDQQISGPLDPDNPLKWGVSQALNNSNGVDVKYTAVCNPAEDTSWAHVLEKLLGRDDVYGLVPLTKRKSVLDLYHAHVDDQSTPENGLWRVLWTNLSGVPVVPIVSAGSTVPGHEEPTTTDGLVALGVVEGDPQTVGNPLTILRCTTGNAQFLVNEVQPGDVVRLLYTSDGFGHVTWSEFLVDEVQSEDQLRMLVGPGAPISTPAKFEIWRNLNATDEAQSIANYAGAWGDRRVRAVWPDQIENSGTIMDGTFLCCALAGLASGILPHQGMTHLAIAGYTSVLRTTQKFNRAQLDIMALGGAWIVTQDLSGLETNLGEIFTRHALTTGGYSDINKREEMLTRNVDSISYRFQDEFRPYIGVTNVTPSIQKQLEIDTDNLIEVLKTESFTQNLGGQLIDGTILSLAPHILLKDRYVMQVRLVVPYPFNNFEIHLLI